MSIEHLYCTEQLRLDIPEGLDLIYLPPKSPELQPAERLWPLTNEIVANSSPYCLDELEKLLVFRCQKLMKQHDLIQGRSLLPLVASN